MKEIKPQTIKSKSTNQTSEESKDVRNLLRGINLIESQVCSWSCFSLIHATHKKKNLPKQQAIASLND